MGVTGQPSFALVPVCNVRVSINPYERGPMIPLDTPPSCGTHPHMPGLGAVIKGPVSGLHTRGTRGQRRRVRLLPKACCTREGSRHWSIHTTGQIRSQMRNYYHSYHVTTTLSQCKPTRYHHAVAHTT